MKVMSLFTVHKIFEGYIKKPLVVKTLSLLFHNSPAKRTMFALREIVLFVCTYVIEVSEKSYVDLSAKFPDFTQAEIEVSRRI